MGMDGWRRRPPADYRREVSSALIQYRSANPISLLSPFILVGGCKYPRRFPVHPSWRRIHVADASRVTTMTANATSAAAVLFIQFMVSSVDGEADGRRVHEAAHVGRDAILQRRRRIVHFELIRAGLLDRPMSRVCASALR